MPKAFTTLSLFLILMFSYSPLFAQDGDVQGSEAQGVDRYDELADKIDQLQNKVNSLVITTDRYASENQRLKDENARLQRELYLVGQALDEARNLSDETSRRFDSSVSEVDQNSWILSDYQRRVEGFCADAWGSADDIDQCSRQLQNFKNLDDRIKSK